MEDVLEPYLIQQGFIARTARGRIATARAYEHFGLAHPGKGGQPGSSPGGATGGLFGDDG